MEGDQKRRDIATGLPGVERPFIQRPLPNRKVNPRQAGGYMIHSQTGASERGSKSSGALMEPGGELLSGPCRGQETATQRDSFSATLFQRLFADQRAGGAAFNSRGRRSRAPGWEAMKIGAAERPR